MALGPTQPSIQWVPGALSLGVKRPGREADHYLHLVPRVKNKWSYNSTPPIRLRGVVDNFIFTFAFTFTSPPAYIYIYVHTYIHT
jgi:hypothetical protein